MKRLQKIVPVFLAIMGFSLLSAAATDRVVVSGLDRPWAVVASPDGNIWITEQTGSVKVYTTAFRLTQTLKSFPELTVYGEGGVLDLAFHPQFKSNGWVYIAYSVADSIGHHTRINRFTYRAGQFAEHKVIFDGPSSNAGTHFGCRLVFDAKGFLYASFGERREMYHAQDLTLMHGKIVRLNDDGSVPRDNPFGSANPIFTLGHRNPQGLAIHPVSQRMYSSEHGPTVYDAPAGGDELNEIIRGTNYGWPTYHHKATAPGFQGPLCDLCEYTPAIAPSGIAFYTGSKIPAWSNDLFVATLRGQHLRRVRIDTNGTVLKQEELLKGKYGRLRDVETSPDGTLLVLSTSGKLIQLN